MYTEHNAADNLYREFPKSGPQYARLTLKGSLVQEPGSDFSQPESGDGLNHGEAKLSAGDIYAGIIAAQERTAALQRHHGWDKATQAEDAARTYAEMFLTPSLSLLNEGLKIVEPARKSARNFEGRQSAISAKRSPLGDAVLGILADGYIALDPAEALGFIDRINNKNVKAESLAKLSQGDRHLAGKARALAGKDVDTLMVVGKYAEDGESLGLALKKTDSIEKVLQMAALGYRPALEKAKTLLLDYYKKDPDAFSIGSDLHYLTKFSKAEIETVRHYGGLDGLVLMVDSIEQKISSGELLPIADGKSANYLQPKEATVQQGEWEKRKAAVVGEKPNLKVINLMPIDDFATRLVARNHQVSPRAIDDIETRINFHQYVLMYGNAINENGPGAVEAVLYKMEDEHMIMGQSEGDIRYLALAQAVKEAALRSDHSQADSAA